jgi:hypothetical protein
MARWGSPWMPPLSLLLGVGQHRTQDERTKHRRMKPNQMAPSTGAAWETGGGVTDATHSAAGAPSPGYDRKREVTGASGRIRRQQGGGNGSHLRCTTGGRCLLLAWEGNKREWTRALASSGIFLERYAFASTTNILFFLPLRSTCFSHFEPNIFKMEPSHSLILNQTFLQWNRVTSLMNQTPLRLSSAAHSSATAKLGSSRMGDPCNWERRFPTVHESTCGDCSEPLVSSWKLECLSRLWHVSLDHWSWRWGRVERTRRFSLPSGAPPIFHDRMQPLMEGATLVFECIFCQCEMLWGLRWRVPKR